MTRFFDYLRTPVLMAQAVIVLLPFYIHRSIASSLPEPDTYSIAYTHTQPVIDGLLDDKLWLQVKPTTDFVIHDSGKPAAVKTIAQLAYDDQYLYLAAASEDQDIYAHYTKNQSYLFRSDDLVEIFIDPDGDGKNYLEAGFSAKAVYYSLLVPEVRDGKVDPTIIEIPDLAYAVHLNGSLNNADDHDQSWTLEARIPLAMLHTLIKADAGNTHWRIGIFRIDYATHKEADKTSGFYAWQYLGKFGFHQPERFAHITFGNPPIP